MVASSNAGWGQGSDAEKDATAFDVVEVHGDAGDVAGEPTRPPFAEMSICSAILAPLNTIEADRIRHPARG
jgi:hypothetical protein